ncbi:hypothetical protein [Winogradskyella pulchriflava]|uniref:Uncharacterized protein n=1 Tax=Winogradskyella pulchriflava TaxID=1110688 RepID=A0ABV6Q793_9FLAO
MKEINDKFYFTLKEAEYLKEHYKDKIIGKIPYDNIKMKIDSIDVVSDNKMFRVKCIGHSLRQPHNTLESYLETIVKELNLESLHEVLKHKDF